jgi:hypothetical protein
VETLVNRAMHLVFAYKCFLFLYFVRADFIIGIWAVKQALNK